ncbi:MAG: low molecular weight phosphotyrosine protein phosphatase [Clostridiales bacterium]|nr:low molecular weight phosphotyrosine protein phosphatase [Clostridiales bacterium]
MIRIMFVCYGNICRSPMAEFLMKDFVKKKGLEDKFYIKSSATSYEEIGHRVYGGTRVILDRLGIDYSGKVAEKLYADDYDNFDYFIGMDESNRRNMVRQLNGDKEGKVSLLLDYTKNPREVADPWYTRDFDLTYRDITEGIEAFFEFLKKHHKDI